MFGIGRSLMPPESRVSRRTPKQERKALFMAVLWNDLSSSGVAPRQTGHRLV